MNSPIAQIGKSTTAALPFDVTNSKPATGGGNFGAELDRATSSRSRFDHNTDKILERRPSQPRSSRLASMKRQTKTDLTNRTSNSVMPQEARSAASKVRVTNSPDTSHPAPRTPDAQPAREQEDDCLAGALAVAAPAKPVETVTETSAPANGEEFEGDRIVSPATGGGVSADTEDAAGLSFTGGANAALTSEGETQTGKSLPAGFEFLQKPEVMPGLAASLPASGFGAPERAAAATKLISVPDSLQKQIELVTKDEAAIGTGSGLDASLPQVAAEIGSAADELSLEGEVAEPGAAPVTDTNVLTQASGDQRPARAVRRADTAGNENGSGISAANLAATMKNVPNKDEFAGLGRQDLPGENFSAGRTVSNNTTKTPVAESLFTIGTMATAKSLDGRGETIAVDDSTRFQPARIERIGEIISREVRMFKRAADDQVDVVLTPDAKTQISLRLQWRDGQVEVQAKCELGDHRALSLQWAQLQTSLAQQGVKLAPLTERTSTGFTEFFSPSSFSHSQNSGGQRQSPPQPPASELPSAPMVSASRRALTTKKAPTNDRFETWA
ncbi:MAG: hypothetical protein HOP33_05090 [Verrucomicrobia bacterium]|nr:hypothetical protein [Verrucomicrobiota bacterium]